MLGPATAWFLVLFLEQGFAVDVQGDPGTSLFPVLGGGSLAHSSRLTFCLKFVVPGILTLHRILALLFKGCGGFHYQRNVIRDPIHIALG